MRIAPFAVTCLVIFTGFQTLLGDTNQYKDYDVNHMNEFWDSQENHQFSTRSFPSQQSVEISDRIISDDEIFLLRYWEPAVIPKDSIDWTEDPFDDWTWQFYYHSLRMVSYLVSAYEYTGELEYLTEAKWYVESWIEHNPDPRQQASERAWDDHSTANRISTFLQFWNSYRDSPIQDETFSILFLNILRLHGEFTADSDNYYWGHNHGIYQDRSLLQLSILFPNFEESNEWNKVATNRLDKHLREDITESGVHKEHSPSYHFLVMSLFMSIDEFNRHYELSNQLLESKIYSMQEYLAYIVKHDGTFPLVGDSGLENGLRLKESSIVSENLLNLKVGIEDGAKFENYCTGYYDAGVGINKLQFSEGENFYFAIFSAFHNSVHKQSDDLSFVLSYDQTDYFVDSGKYNFDEADPYRQYVRSVFAHNTIVVDGESYDYRDPENFGQSELYNFECNETYSIFQAKHTIYDGVEINRNVVVLYDQGIIIHDSIKSQENHDYSQVFNIGADVEIQNIQYNEILLSSRIDNSSLFVTQMTNIASIESFHGSDNPKMGWRSESFNQIHPISSIVFSMTGSSEQFQTVIHFNEIEFDVQIEQNDSGDYTYQILGADGNQIYLTLD
jgi:hypothetical protein